MDETIASDYPKGKLFSFAVNRVCKICM